tara:strand:+ start:412 stop:621 length:210 start_codon:yes stop_codon:yes gene_type:complete
MMDSKVKEALLARGNYLMPRNIAIYNADHYEPVAEIAREFRLSRSRIYYILTTMKRLVRMYEMKLGLKT